MNLWGDTVKFKEDNERKYFKNMWTYSKNNLICSDEPCEFRIIGGTPDGKIVTPNKIISIPCHIKKVVIERKSVTIKDSKIVSIDRIQSKHNKYIEIKIKYRVSFNIRLYDKYNNIYKIRCYLDKYPTPNKQSYIKKSISVYSIVSTRFMIKCNKENYEPNIHLTSNAYIKDVKCKLCKPKKFITWYNVNCEAYLKLIVGIAIHRYIKISWYKKCNVI